MTPVDGKSPYEQPADAKLPTVPPEGDRAQNVFNRVVRPPAPPVGRVPQAPPSQAPRVPVGRGHIPPR